MKYLVTAFPRNPLSQKVFAENGDAAIEAALANPNRWSISTPSDDKDNWYYYAVPIDESSGCQYPNVYPIAAVDETRPDA